MNLSIELETEADALIVTEALATFLSTHAEIGATSGSITANIGEDEALISEFRIIPPDEIEVMKSLSPEGLKEYFEFVRGGSEEIEGDEEDE